jgi:hypothetical protein
VIDGPRGPFRRDRVLVAAAMVAVAGASVWAVGFGRSRSTSRPSTLIGAAVDLERHSRPVFTVSREIKRCAQLLPGGKVLRLFLTGPMEAIDVDLAEGRSSPSTLLPETFASGCPQLSPDGRHLLFEKEQLGRRPQVMLSGQTDGREAAMITEGDGPFWLPSGDAFLYRMDETRSAVFAIGRGPVLLPERIVGVRSVADHAINERGDKVGVMFLERDSGLKLMFEIYSYPQPALERRVALPLNGQTWSTYDLRRNAWQLSLADGRYLVRCELRSDGDCERLLSLSGAHVIGSYRSEVGLAAIVNRKTYSTVLKSRDGALREYFDENGADFTSTGDAVLGLRLDDGRAVIGAQRWNEREPAIRTNGPLDVFPAIAPDGKHFTYSRGYEKVVLSCPLDEGSTEHCRTIHKDPLGTSFPRLSPDGQLLAYVALSTSGWRLRIVPMGNGPSTDLSVRTVRAIRWSSPTTLWMCVPEQKSWVEVDAIAARLTGKTVQKDEFACEYPPAGTGEPASFEVRRVLSVTSEVRLARGL